MTGRIVFIVLSLALAVFMYVREERANKHDKTHNPSELDTWLRQNSHKSVRALLILAGLQILLLVLDVSEGRSSAIGTFPPLANGDMLG
ncbi:MAG: hypothetical protein H6990_05655 [Pseudomonadales bacterium]|nr:hypothetical protein [Pseudomonadales bacterium]MCP5204331.1 hypothetical protein [Pseudomonadales bacterium]